MYFHYRWHSNYIAKVFPSFNLNVEKRNFSSVLDGNSNTKDEDSIFLRIFRSDFKEHVEYPTDNRPFSVRLQEALMQRNQIKSLPQPKVYFVSMDQGRVVAKLLKALQQSFFFKGRRIKVSSLPVSPSYVFYFFSNSLTLSEFKQNLQVLPLSSFMPFKNLRYLATKIPFVWKSKVQYNISQDHNVSGPLIKKSVVRDMKYRNQFFFSIFKKNSMEHAALVDFKHLKARRKRKKNLKQRIRFRKINLLWHSIYKDPVIEKFVNCIMKHGRRVKAENLFIKTLVYLKEFTKKQPILIVHRALQFCQPILEARALMGSRKAHFIPKEVTLRRRVMIAVKSLIKVARENSARKQPFHVRLAHELLLAANDDGKAIEKVKSIHEKAFANRANLRYSGGRKKRKR
jgi:small subunit ribosomal protein S7